MSDPKAIPSIHQKIYRPGARVECIDSDFDPSARAILHEIPVKGAIYTIEKFDFTRSDATGGLKPSIQVAEIRCKPAMARLARPYWDVLRFRPVLSGDDKELLTALENLENITPGMRDILNSLEADPAAALNLLNAFLFLDGWYAMARTNLTLAYMVANCAKFDGLPEEGSTDRKRQYLRMKRPLICGAMGFPATESSVSILARTVLGSLDLDGIQNIRLLRMLLRHDPIAARLLVRKKRITDREVGALAFGIAFQCFNSAVTDEEIDSMDWFFSRPLQERVLVMEAWHHVSFCNEAIVEILAGKPRRIASFKKCSTAIHWMEKAANVRRKVYFAASKVCRAMKLDTPWPDPPIPGIEEIQPILSIEELSAEGREMGNCAASYANTVMRGEYFIYRVMAPTRCTLGLQYIKSRWVQGELQDQTNQPCKDPATKKFVADWLAQHQSELPNNRWQEFMNKVLEQAGLYESLKAQQRG